MTFQVSQVTNVAPAVVAEGADPPDFPGASPELVTVQ